MSIQRSSPLRSRDLLGVVLGVLALTAARPAVADDILFNDGRPPKTNVSVINESLDVVEYKDPRIRQPQSFDSAVVAEVKYSGRHVPDEYALAFENLEEHAAFELAAQMFESVSEQVRGDRDGLKANCLFNRAEALRRGGLLTKAVEAYDDFLQQYPKSRYSPMAQLSRARALKSGGDVARARKAFEDLKKFGDRWEMEAELNLLILNGASVSDLQRIAGATETKYPAVSNQAKLEIGRAMIRDGNVADARDYFQTIIDNRGASSREIAAGAYNGLGAALFAEAENKSRSGDAAGSEQLFKKALMNYLRADLTYDDVLEEQPEAMFGAGSSFLKVEGQDNQQRGKAILGRLVKQFPDTEWAERARGG